MAQTSSTERWTGSFDHTRFSAFVCGDPVHEGDRIRLPYRLVSTTGRDVEFEEELTFDGVRTAGPAREIPGALLSLLHQVAAVSYAKTACPPRFVVSGGVDERRRVFLDRLHRHGLAEFAERNGLDLTERLVIAAEDRPCAPAIEVELSRRVLLPFGGGKDSLLSLQLLEEQGFEPHLLVVGPAPVAVGLARATGRPLVTVHRRLDPKIATLNAAGAWNGHVPVTAINSLIAIIAALREGIGTVVMSNESSANTGTIRPDGEVNHQYSKSLAFERDLADELAAVGAGRFEYFSILRPWTSLAVCRAFARRGRFLDGFVSCNRNFVRNRISDVPGWCLECPKCLFVHLCLAPFVARARLAALFGGDPLDAVENVPGYADLLQLEGGSRPFECVGEAREAREAMRILLATPEYSSAPCVNRFRAELAHVEAEGPVYERAAHRIPDRFRGVLDAFD